MAAMAASGPILQRIRPIYPDKKNPTWLGKLVGHPYSGITLGRDTGGHLPGRRSVSGGGGGDGDDSLDDERPAISGNWFPFRVTFSRRQAYSGLHFVQSDVA